MTLGVTSDPERLPAQLASAAVIGWKRSCDSNCNDGLNSPTMKWSYTTSPTHACCQGNQRSRCQGCLGYQL